MIANEMYVLIIKTKSIGAKWLHISRKHQQLKVSNHN